MIVFSVCCISVKVGGINSVYFEVQGLKCKWGSRFKYLIMLSELVTKRRRMLVDSCSNTTVIDAVK